MKKRIISILSLIIVMVLITGCNSGIGSSKPNFEVLDSKVNYLVINDKKIYLTRQVKDFVLQFKGMGCSFNNENLDEMDENDPLLVNSYRYNDLVCYKGNETSLSNRLSISFNTYTSDQGDINDIYYWQFSAYTYVNYDININNKTLLIGDFERKPSTAEDLIKVLGSEYEQEESYYIYKDGDLEYSFRVDDDTNGLEFFSISIN